MTAMAEPMLTPTQVQALAQLLATDPLGIKGARLNPHVGRALVTRGLARQPTLLMEARSLYVLTPAGREMAQRPAEEKPTLSDTVTIAGRLFRVRAWYAYRSQDDSIKPRQLDQMWQITRGERAGQWAVRLRSPRGKIIYEVSAEHFAAHAGEEIAASGAGES